MLYIFCQACINLYSSVSYIRHLFMKALIPAARDAKTRPFWRDKNKHLLPLANTPMIVYALSALERAGLRDIGIVIGPNDEDLKGFLGNGERFGVSLSFITQNEPRGIAHAVMSAKEYLGDDSFVLHLGDNIVRENIAMLLDAFMQADAACLLALAKVRNPERFGVPIFEGEKIRGVEERPFKPQSPFAVTGVYVYHPMVHALLPELKVSARGDYEISDLHTRLVQDGQNVHWVEVSDWWKDTGQPEDLIDGNRFVLEGLRGDREGSVAPGVVVKGPVRIGEGSKILGRSVVLGPAVIGQNCLITDSYIGPYSSIGNNVELHGAEIENSVVFDGVRVASAKRIQASILGEGSIVASEQHTKPSGHRIIVGEGSVVDL